MSNTIRLSYLFVYFMNIELYISFYIVCISILTIGALLKVLYRVFTKDYFGKLPRNNLLTRYLDTCAFVVAGNWDAVALVIGGRR